MERCELDHPVQNRDQWEARVNMSAEQILASQEGLFYGLSQFLQFYYNISLC
jgi:dihydrodipicolinate reductase